MSAGFKPVGYGDGYGYGYETVNNSDHIRRAKVSP